MVKELSHLLLTNLLRMYLELKLPSQPPPAGSLLLIAPHPDDEVFGAGGLLLAALEARHEVHILFLTNGEKSCVHRDESRIQIERSKLIDTVRMALGIPAANIHRFHLPDGSVPHIGEPGFFGAVENLISLIDGIQPAHVLATHNMDYWPYDHVACAEMALAASRDSSHKPRIFLYWVWAWYNLRPWRLCLKKHPRLMKIDISKWAAAKRRLVDLYERPRAPSGQPWGGRLPWAMRQTARFKFEVLEEINAN